MKDSLFEMLLSLFEQTITKLKESHEPTENKTVAESEEQADIYNPLLVSKDEMQPEMFQLAKETSTRILTYDEQVKLTKASYQFLMRMSLWGVISPETLELILNQLLFSESRFVSLQETKWTIRSILEDKLDAEQLAFLDLVLYQKEDKFPLH